MAHVVRLHANVFSRQKLFLMDAIREYFLLLLNYYYYYLNIFIHGSLSVACFSKGRGLKLLKRYKTKSKPKV